MSEQDHYEILGIRPNAGRDEIDLAYKGRRSQYHPDRYSQADAETQAWATGKMQQVNEAYRVLTSVASRATFDRRRPRPSAEAGQRSPRQDETPPTPRSIDPAAVLLNPKWEWFHDKVYAKPNIPPRKLEGAISSYAYGVAPHEVIVLLDDTLFAGAKEGLLVTNDAIYCKQKFERPRRVAMSAIREAEPGTHSRVFINGREFFKADLIDHLAVLTFAARLSKVFQPTGGQSDSKKASTREGGGPGIDRLRTIHRNSLRKVRDAFDGEVALIDDLIDRQMQSIANEYASLRSMVEADRRTNQKAIAADAACAELALQLLLILHFYGFSQLPSDIRSEPGDEFTPLLNVSEMYHDKYREQFARVFGCSMEMDEESMLMMSLAFYHPDGAPGGIDMKLPRKEALLRVFTQMGMPQDTTAKLIRQAEQNARSWFASVVEMMNQ